MKLIALLLQELPKRGGWPKGAKRARQDDDCEICFEGSCATLYDFYVNEMSCDTLDWFNENTGRATSDFYVTKQQYLKALGETK